MKNQGEAGDDFTGLHLGYGGHVWSAPPLNGHREAVLRAGFQGTQPEQLPHRGPELGLMLS